jgi:hypothetical protein
MVPSLAKGQIDLSTLSVTGKAKPAVKDDAPGSVIAAPAVAGELTVVPPASAKDPAAVRKPAHTQAADAVPAPAAAAAEHAASAAAAKPAPAAAAPAVELHGGSVPAPAQKVPGQ